jgi:hypothetical protein
MGTVPLPGGVLPDADTTGAELADADQPGANPLEAIPTPYAILTGGSVLPLGE